MVIQLSALHLAKTATATLHYDHAVLDVKSTKQFTLQRPKEEMTPHHPSLHSVIFSLLWAQSPCALADDHIFAVHRQKHQVIRPRKRVWIHITVSDFSIVFPYGIMLTYASSGIGIVFFWHPESLSSKDGLGYDVHWLLLGLLHYVSKSSPFCPFCWPSCTGVLVTSKLVPYSIFSTLCQRLCWVYQLADFYTNGVVVAYIERCWHISKIGLVYDKVHGESHTILKLKAATPISAIWIEKPSYSSLPPPPLQLLVRKQWID